MNDDDTINARLVKLEEAQREVSKSLKEVGKTLLDFRDFVDAAQDELEESLYVKRQLVNLIGVLIDRVFAGDNGGNATAARHMAMRLFTMLNGESTPPKENEAS